MRPSAPPILALLLVLAAVPPLRAAQPDAPTPSAEPPKADAAMANWVRQVHAIVLKATNPLTRRLKLGVYRVSFTVDDRGRGSNYDAKGDQSDAKQSSMIG